LIPLAVAFAAFLAFLAILGDVMSVVLIVAVMAVAWLSAWYFLERWFARDRMRRAKGLCRNCGYDLTGNVSGVCPECGEATR